MDQCVSEFRYRGSPEQQSILMIVIKIRALLRNLFSPLISDVPADSARCEYVCDRLECPPEIFDNCKKRKDYQALGRDN